MTRSLLSLVVLATVACAASQSYQPTPTSDVFTGKDYPALWTSPEGKIKPVVDRAPFDLNCPAEQLTYQRVGTSYSVAVSGCGRRAMYQFVNGVGWVANTISEDVPASETEATSGSNSEAPDGEPPIPPS